MAGDVEYVVDTSHDGEVACLGVAHRTVTGQIGSAAEVHREVGFLVALRVAPDGTNHRGPRFLDDQEAAFAPFDISAGFVDDRRLDARKRQRAGTGNERCHAGQGRNDMAAGFRLPEGIDDRAALAAHHRVVPHPGFGVDRLANRAQQSQ